MGKMTQRWLPFWFAPVLFCAEPAGTLETMVARIASYPDPLLAQVLVASTYPLEVLDAASNSKTKGAQDWDASVQSLTAFPEVLDLMASDLPWTLAMGNAVLGQQRDVLAAVQRVRSRTSGKTAPRIAMPVGGWGWYCNWDTGAIVVNQRFFRRHGYAPPRAGSAEVQDWTHNPYHRRAAPYDNIASRRVTDARSHRSPRVRAPAPRRARPSLSHPTGTPRSAAAAVQAAPAPPAIADTTA